MAPGGRQEASDSPGHARGAVEEAQRSAGAPLSNPWTKFSPEKGGAPPGVLDRGTKPVLWDLVSRPQAFYRVRPMTLALKMTKWTTERGQ